jgi:LPXTG-motif cell wall-anchored protein
MLKKFIFLFSLAGLCLLFIFPKTTLCANGITEEIGIETSPHKVFFEITNVRPGDIYTKVLTIQNNGSQNFNYLFSNRFLTGSESFYNELLLKVTDQSGVLFSGKLKDFNKLNSRLLKSNKSEKLALSISIPQELGNGFQGLDTEFQFNFYVEGTLGGLLPADGPKLPETGSNMYNILVLGAVLILFGLILQFAKRKRKQL